MATRKKTTKKQKLEDLPAQEDPRAPLSAALLLRAAQPALKALAADLLARAKASAAVTSALKARHGEEKAAERTADPYDTWLRALVEQVAAAWVLSCVFVRVLEDRGLVEQHRLAGPGAPDSQQLFFQLAPSLSERDYLLMVFRELSELPAAADLFDARHNPVWLLAPSAEGARSLLSLFRTPSPHAPALRFGQEDTRFLGDLYQDLSESVRKRYALLQTPDFIERFILDRTLERAIERFGLEETTLIDPTCGSGHFLLGAFERLVEHRLRSEPGIDVRQAAFKALDAVSGADINAYAVAIARFRLTLAYLDKAGHDNLAQAPKLPLHLVVADSLLHNPQGKLEHAKDSASQVQIGLGEIEGVERTDFESELYALEDKSAAKDVLYRRYAAVVGNPPYITVKDKALRAQYRRIYSTCHGGYSVAVPFTERFFQLARQGGAVGMITANSFMKREFGKKLIQDFLPTVNLYLIVNTSGAYIPGHGTPTVLLFGTAEGPKRNDVLAILARRGEPATPDEPEEGFVWKSIADHWSDERFENDYITVSKVDRDFLRAHPWSLSGGGAADLKELLEDRSPRTLRAVADEIGFVCMTRADDIYFAPRDALRRAGIGEQHIVENVEGEVIRDWAISEPSATLFPYDEDLKPTHDAAVRRFLWPYRTHLWLRREPNGNHREIGLSWWEWSRFQRERYRALMKLAFAEVASHNHFVLDRGGKAFKQTAPILKLPDGATEDEHFALLAYLNSSAACFWMKQVCHQKQMMGGDGIRVSDGSKVPFQFSGTALSRMPVPNLEHVRSILVSAAREIELRISALAELEISTETQLSAGVEPTEILREYGERRQQFKAELVGLQERIDWAVYSAFRIVPHDEILYADAPHDPGQRAFELTMREDGLRRTNNGHEISDPNDEATLRCVRRRQAETASNKSLRLLESPNCKRRWIGRQGLFNSAVATAEDRFRTRLRDDWLSRAERLFRATEPRVQSRRSVLRAERAPLFVEWALGGSIPTHGGQAISAGAVPYLAAHRYTESGLEKRADWERCWALQRREDAGEEVGEILLPPKYGEKDFRAANYWRLRGKFDVPKEPFISYPGCASDEDGEPLYGWVGWSEFQRAQALAGLYEQRKAEGWGAERLTPMLAGILELLPWVKQWHNEPSAEYDDRRLGDYFESYLDNECATHSLSRKELRAWRPPDKRKAGRHKNVEKDTR